MELSTIMPTPMAMPPRDIMFSVRLKARMRTKTVKMQMGMDLKTLDFFVHHLFLGMAASFALVVLFGITLVNTKMVLIPDIRNP